METRHPKPVRTVIGAIPLLAAFLAVGCALTGPTSKPISADRLIDIDGIYYTEENTNSPFSGSIESLYSATNKQRRMYAEIRKGKLEGAASIWHESGKPYIQLKYNANNRVLRKEWDDMGKLISDYSATKPKPTATISTNSVFDPATGLPSTNQPPTIVTNAPPAEKPKEFLLTKLKLRGQLYYESEEALFPFTGVAIEYHSGKKKKREENLEGGERNGRTTWWHKNGVKSFEAFYIRNKDVPSNSLPDGTVSHWFETGKLRMVAQWVNGAEIKRTTYAPDGQESGALENGSGSLVYYDEKGKKQLEETYENGALVKEQWYRADGSLEP